MSPYATPGDLAGWLTADQLAQIAAGDDTRLLDRATELVADAAVAGYAVDTTGAPSDATVAGALRDACCAVVEQWLEVGEENDISGYSRATTLSVGGLNVSLLPAVLAPRARRILRTAGLTRAVAW